MLENLTFSETGPNIIGKLLLYKHNEDIFQEILSRSFYLANSPFGRTTLVTLIDNPDYLDRIMTSFSDFDLEALIKTKYGSSFLNVVTNRHNEYVMKFKAFMDSRKLQFLGNANSKSFYNKLIYLENKNITLA